MVKKNPLQNNYKNWIGDVTNEEVPEENGEVTFFTNYTEIQMDSLVELCNHINEKHNIPLKCIGHNVKVERVEKYEGITSKSNYDRICTSLSPVDFDHL